jgi:hypothetical protein
MSEAVGTQPVADPEHDHVVVREVLRGYRLHGRMARPSRVFVGEHKSGAAVPPPEEAIGADEAAAAATAALEDTVPIDEAMMRELFGTGEEPEPK